MTKHRCDKEKELTEIFDRLNKVEICTTETHTIVKRLDKALSGNGQKGIIAEFLEFKGGMKVWKWIAGSGLIISITTIINMIIGG